MEEQNKKRAAISDEQVDEVSGGNWLTDLIYGIATGGNSTKPNACPRCCGTGMISSGETVLESDDFGRVHKSYVQITCPDCGGSGQK